MQCDKRVYFCSFSLRFNEVPYIKTEHYPPGISTYHQADFNPRSRKESDQWLKDISFYITAFQSTLSQGERHGLPIQQNKFVPFQSTLSQGERRLKASPKNMYKAFQSTLSQGERLVPYRLLWRHWKISIHALARRATNLHYRVSKCNGISIHALARRATSAPFPSAIIVFNFNPRSRKESDCCHKSLKGTKK